MIKMISTVKIILLSAVLTSCSSLKSQYYVGEKMPISEEELSKESVWKFGDDVFHVQQVDTNTLIASTIEWDKENQKHTVSTRQLVLSELGDVIFLNIKEDNLYTILRLVGGDDGSLVLLTVDSDKVEKDIAEGNIKAEKIDHDIITNCSKKELDQYVLENIQTLFSLDSACVGKLISGEME